MHGRRDHEETVEGPPQKAAPGASQDLGRGEPVADRIGELLGREVPLIKDWIDGVEVAAGEVALLENVRFLEGEKKCDEALSRKMAALCDVLRCSAVVWCALIGDCGQWPGTGGDYRF